MSSLGKIMRCFNDDSYMIEQRVQDAKRNLFDFLEQNFPVMSSEVSNDPLIDEYIEIVELFVDRAEALGFVENVGGYRTINDASVSEVFEDIVISVDSFSHVNNVKSAKAILSRFSDDVLQLNTLGNEATPSILLLSHYQRECGEHLKPAKRSVASIEDEVATGGSYSFPNVAVAAPN